MSTAVGMVQEDSKKRAFPRQTNSKVQQTP